MTEGIVRVDATYIIVAVLVLGVAAAIYFTADTVHSPAVPEITGNVIHAKNNTTPNSTIIWKSGEQPTQQPAQLDEPAPQLPAPNTTTNNTTTTPIRRSGGGGGGGGGSGGGSSPPADNDAPAAVLDAPAANHVFASGTTQVTVLVTTDEDATCRYGMLSSTTYANMGDTFSSTGGTNHQTILSNLVNGQSYTRYVRCSDEHDNAMTQSLTVSFSIGSPSNPGNNTTSPDTTAPSASVIAPSSGQILPAGTTSTALTVTTNEAATCRWDVSSSTAFASMTNTFTTTGGTSHSTTLSGLANGQSYTRYVRCRDNAGNAMSQSALASFSVSTPPVNPSPGNNTTPEVTPGRVVVVTVNSGSVTSLGGVQFSVSYNPAVLRFDSVTEGSFLDNGNSTAAMLLDTAVAQNGVVRDIILLRVAQPGRTGSGQLATLRFTAIGSGNTNIAISSALLSNAAAQPLPNTLTLTKAIS